MKGVELYGRVRYAVQIEGLSERAAARRFGIDPRTVSKMVKFSVPPGCRDRLHAWLLQIVGALTAHTFMALTCRWRSRPQHHKRTFFKTKRRPTL